jgi:hypothetical protein
VTDVAHPGRQRTFQVGRRDQRRGHPGRRPATGGADRDEHVLGQAEVVEAKPGPPPDPEEDGVGPAVEASLVIRVQAGVRGRLVPEQRAETGQRGGEER